MLSSSLSEININMNNNETKIPHTIKSKKKKQVTFAEKAYVRLALHINDYTDDEFHSSFYSQNEFIEMKEDVKRTVTKIALKQYIDEVNYSKRGVESNFTAKAVELRKRRRRAALFAVFMEQDSFFGDEDDEEILDEEEEQEESAAAMHMPIVECKKSFAMHRRELLALNTMATCAAGRIALIYSAVVHGSVASGYKLGLLDEEFVNSEVYYQSEADHNSTPQVSASSSLSSIQNGLLLKLRQRASDGIYSTVSWNTTRKQRKVFTSA